MVNRRSQTYALGYPVWTPDFDPDRFRTVGRSTRQSGRNNNKCHLRGIALGGLRTMLIDLDSKSAALARGGITRQAPV